MRFNHTISFLPVFDKHNVAAAEHIRIAMWHWHPYVLRRGTFNFLQNRLFFI